MRKILFIIGTTFVFISLANAQMMDIKAGALSKIEVYHIYGKIDIQGTNDNRIVIEIAKKNPVPKEFEVVNDNDYKKSNSNLDLNVKERGSTFSVYPSSKQAQFSDYIIKIPSNFKVQIINDGEEIERKIWSEGSVQSVLKSTILIDSITNEIEIETHSSNLICKDISGPVIANVFAANVDITFKEFNQVLPSSIETFSGNINVYLPSDINCNVKLHSFSGNVNSEFNLKDVKVNYSQNDVRIKTIKSGEGLNKQQVNNAKINGKINKGGAEINLGAFSGNINLLKIKQ
jgi:hypothetical protein